MIGKATGAAALLAGGLWMGGAFGAGEWSREVGRPPTQVAAALETLDIRDQPGAPGTDPSRSGGVMPVFRLDRIGNRMRWRVMSGDKVATSMIADLSPTTTGTHVVAHVERGDAPDDYVSPAFRSPRLTLALFSMALEGKLNALTRPANGSAADCAALERQFEQANMAAGSGDRSASLTQAVGGTAAMVMRLNAYGSERDRLGCAPADAGDGGFRSVEMHMTPAPEVPAGDPREHATAANPRFRAGEPMVDAAPGN